MKISYALKVKCENSERTLESYLKETQMKAQAQNGNQIVALNEMDISQLEFICMKDESGGMEANENFIKNVDCGPGNEVLSNDLNAKNNSNGHQQHQQQQQHSQHQQQQQQHSQQSQQQQHRTHQQQQQHIMNVAHANLAANSSNASAQQAHPQQQQSHQQPPPQKVVKLDLLKLYPNSLLDQNFAIEEVIEDNMNNMTGAVAYEPGIIRGSIIDPNNIQLASNEEEIIEENINDSNLLEDCEIEEVVENDDMEQHHDQDSSHQFIESRNNSQFGDSDLDGTKLMSTSNLDGSGLDLDDNRTELDNDGIDEAYKCPGCSTVFLYNETLRKHIFENHTNKDLCMICNKGSYR